IDRSVASILKIREYLVSKQVELADWTDGSLFFLFEFMAQGIRQFLTYEERLKVEFAPQPPSGSADNLRRPAALRQGYFDALTVLRQHLQMALNQIALIAGISAPKIPEYLQVQSWELSNYLTDVSETDRPDL